MDRKTIYTREAPEPVGPYSQAVKAKGWIFVSGQIPMDPKTGEQVTGSFESQARVVLDNLKAILDAGGASLESVVKVTIFLDDMDNFSKLNTIYAEYFAKSSPARACVEVSRLPKGVALEIEAIGCCD